MLREKYFQVLHDSTHCITVSNIDIQQSSVTNSVNVFYSYLTVHVSLNVKKQVTRPRSRQVNFDIVNIMSQRNGTNCGIFALACATELEYGCDPTVCC